jgi:hypothetical protein
MADARADNGELAPFRLYAEDGVVKLIQGDQKSIVIHPSAVPGLCDALLEVAERLEGRDER